MTWYLYDFSEVREFYAVDKYPETAYNDNQLWLEMFGIPKECAQCNK